MRNNLIEPGGKSGRLAGRWTTFLIHLALCLSAKLALAQGEARETPAAEASREELEQSSRSLRQQIDDPKNDLPQRESFAMELATLLDRAAQSAKDYGEQRKLWDEAVGVIDEFERNHPAHPQSRQFQLQAAVYRWATARGLRRQVDLNLSKDQLGEESIAALDDAINRFRKISKAPTEKNDALESNLKFRFAQALADRADFDKEPAYKAQLETEAKSLVEGALAEATIRGFAHLLKGELLRREGHFDAALAELDMAAKSAPPPPERQLVGVRSAILTGMKHFDEALSLIQKSKMEESAKHLMVIRVLLAKRSEEPAEKDHYSVDIKIFQEMSSLRKLPGPDSRMATLALSRTKFDLDPRLGASAWEMLADAHEVAGDPVRASGLAEKAAIRAEDSGQPDQALADRLKAGALLFRAGKYLEAHSALTRMTGGKTTENSELRAKAGLLSALSLGRALATGVPGALSTSYKQALEAQIKEFPNDPSSDEARWLLGDLLLAEGNRERALKLWSAIKVKSPRWLESRREIASIDRYELMTREPENNPTRVSDRFRRAADFLDKSIQEAPNDNASTELLLDRAMLDLSPDARNSDEAREISERVSKSAVTGPQRFRSDLVRMIALAQLGRYVEAELVARRISELPEPGEPAVLLEAIRLLDRSAALSESDLRQRRFGLLMRMLLTPLLARDISNWPSSDIPELSMRLTRALIFVSDTRAAKASIAAWRGTSVIKKWNDALLRDLADTYAQLDAYSLSIDVQRLRLKSVAAGSPHWFDAKYGLALALYRSGKPQEAAQLIDATAILHPELGGSPLKDKFIRLRQRLGD